MSDSTLPGISVKKSLTTSAKTLQSYTIMERNKWEDRQSHVLNPILE